MAQLGESPYLVENDYYLEQAGGTQYNRPIGAGSSRITEVEDPGGSGVTVLRAELQKGDTFPTADARCQLDSDFVIEPEAIVWNRFYIRCPSSEGPPVITGSNFLQLYQMFGAPNENVAPFALKLHEETSAAGVNSVSIFRNGTYSFDRPYTETLELDVWYEWTIRMKFDYTGWIEVWLRKAASIADFTGELTSEDQITFWETGHTGTPGNADTTKLEYETRDAGCNDEEDNSMMPQLYRKAGEWSPFHVYWGELLLATSEADLITRSGEAEVGEITTARPYAYASGGVTILPA